MNAAERKLSVKRKNYIHFKCFYESVQHVYPYAELRLLNTHNMCFSDSRHFAQFVPSPSPALARFFDLCGDDCRFWFVCCHILIVMQSRANSALRFYVYCFSPVSMNLTAFSAFAAALTIIFVSFFKARSQD